MRTHNKMYDAYIIHEIYRVTGIRSVPTKVLRQ